LTYFVAFKGASFLFTPLIATKQRCVARLDSSQIKATRNFEVELFCGAAFRQAFGSAI
jgi:hypothetical protein